MWSLNLGHNLFCVSKTGSHIGHAGLEHPTQPKDDPELLTFLPVLGSMCLRVGFHLFLSSVALLCSPTWSSACYTAQACLKHMMILLPQLANVSHTLMSHVSLENDFPRCPQDIKNVDPPLDCKAISTNSVTAQNLLHHLQGDKCHPG